MFFEPLRTDGFNENEWMRIDTDSDILTSVVLYNRVIIYSSAAPIPVRAEWSRHGKQLVLIVCQLYYNTRNRCQKMKMGFCFQAHVSMRWDWARGLSEGSTFLCLNLYLVYPLDNILRYCIHFSVQYQINLINLISFL